MTAPAETGPIYLYGLVDRDSERLVDALAECTVVDGAGPARLAQAGGATAIVSPHGGAPVARRRRNMLAHAKLLEAAMRHGAVLPAQFGIVAQSPTALDALLEAGATAISAAFERIAGHAAFGIRIRWPREAAMSALVAAAPEFHRRHVALAKRGAAAHFERIELGRRVAEELDTRRKAAERELVRALSPLAASHVLNAAEDDVEVLRAEFLLPQGADGDFLRCAEQACAALDFAPGAEPEIKLIGPTPPYHFVTLPLAPHAAHGVAADG